MRQSGDKWWLLYHPKVEKRDIPKLDSYIRLRVRKAIEQKLLLHPATYGIPLRGTLDQYFKIRVGDWRIIFEISESKHEVRILIIAHRRDVYEILDRRVN